MKGSGFKMRGYSYPGTSPKASPARGFWSKLAGGLGRLIRTGHWKRLGAPKHQGGIVGGYSEGHAGSGTAASTAAGQGTTTTRPPK